MKRLPVFRVRYAIALDVAWIIASYVGSNFIRFEAPASTWSHVLTYQNLLWLSLLIRIPTYAAFGLYQRLWRYAGARELVVIAAACTSSSLVVAFLNFGLLPALGLPYCVSRSVVVLDWLLNLAGLGGTRLVLRLFQETLSTRQMQLAKGSVVPSSRRVLIAGAGDAGAMIVREMRANPGLGLCPVGFVDDDHCKQGLRIHGVRVLGSLDDISVVARQQQIDEVVAAMPTAPGRVIRKLRQVCKDAALPFRTVPGIYELLDGEVNPRQLRPLKIEDLLRRDPVSIDQAGIRALFLDKVVLVTGAGGSIGSELCRQLARFRPRELLLLGHGEFSIFNIERELRGRFPDLAVRPIIADIRDAERMDWVFSTHRPAAVFHAAAHKHVPLMESNVEEAFVNNVIGTRNVLRAAERHGVKTFVLISSDKAVNPTNVMGATKRAAEMLVLDSAAHTGRAYVAVRFGNVLGSRGSAVPIFQEQIAEGGPVTVTHPEMRRFFMTIPEAVQLVLQAAALGSGGEVFLLDMGELVKIVDLVTDLIELSGLRPGVDVEIVFTGTRPGEKLYEELFLPQEDYGTTMHDKIFVSANAMAGLIERERLDRQIDAVAGLARSMRGDEVVARLCDLIPGFSPDCAGRGVTREDSSEPVQPASIYSAPQERVTPRFA